MLLSIIYMFDVRKTVNIEQPTKYLDQSRLKIVSIADVRIRKLEGKELGKSGSNYCYVIEHGVGGRHCHSDMELLSCFAREIGDISEPVSLYLNFDYDEKKYPYNDPKFGLESILDCHNKQSSYFHVEINEEADNPFSIYPVSGITEEQAYGAIEKMEEK